jgi:beta-glucosidase
MMDVSYDDEETWNMFIKQMTLDEMLNVLDDAQGNSWAVSESIGLAPLSLGDGVDGPNGVSIDLPYEDTTGKYGSGRVESVSMTCFTSKPLLTGTFNRELYANRGKFIGEFGLWSGKQEFWTLGANFHRTPFSGRNFEYCSEDANLCYMALVPEAIEMEKRGVIACAKHPAGNDQETMRIGCTIFTNEQSWREGSLRACEGALRVAKVKGYMQSYLRIGLVSTMRSEAFNLGVVFEEWGFRGSVITDCTNAREDGYQGDYIDQLAAGTDRFCMTNAQIVKAQVQSYLDESDDGDYVQYILRAAKDYCYEMSRSNMVNGMSSNTIIRHLTPWWQTAFLVLIVLSAILTAACVVMLTICKVKENKLVGGKKHE